jgi:hypothetical protein
MSLSGSSVIEDQQINGLLWQIPDSILCGQLEQSLLELDGGKSIVVGVGGNFTRSRKERRDPLRKCSTGDGPSGCDWVEDLLRGNLGEELVGCRVKLLRWIEGEKIGKKAGGVRRSHGGS